MESTIQNGLAGVIAHNPSSSGRSNIQPPCVSERSKKRTHTSYSSSVPDRSSHSAGYDKGKASKKTESSSALDHSSTPQVATVTAHCNGCGKLEHKREECKSNGSHPDFNKTGPWIGCSSYNASHVATQLPRWILNHHRTRVVRRLPISPGELRLLPLRSQ